jgi:hypothetical protein
MTPVSTDAHSISDLDLVRRGNDQARPGGTLNVLNPQLPTMGSGVPSVQKVDPH